MMVKTRAIVLRQVKYNDTKMIVDMLTEAVGRTTFFVALPKSSKARVKRQYFATLTFLDIEFDLRERASMQRLKNVAIAMPLPDIATSPIKMTIAIFLSELLVHATSGEQVNRPLFLFIWNSLLWLEHAQTGIANFHLVFMLHLLPFLGFSPNLEHDSGQYFDLEEGRFVNAAPLHAHFLNAADSQHMLTLMRISYASMHLLQIKREERNRCIAIALTYYRLHIPSFPELKSLAVLQDVMR